MRLLDWMVRDGESFFRQGSNARHRAAHGVLAQIHAPVVGGYLTSFSTHPEADIELSIHARPILNGSPIMFPVCRVKWAVTDRGLAISLHVALFAFEQSDSGLSMASSRGWRFESPSRFDFQPTNGTKGTEGNEGTGPLAGGVPQPVAVQEGDRPGVHDYYHAQPIRGWSAGAPDFDKLVTPVNTSQPAFRLMAVDAPSLLVAAIVSLYGLEAHVAELNNLPGLPADAKIPLVPVSASGAWPNGGGRRRRK